MGTNGPSGIPVPLSSFPGATVQESAGRIINCYAEPLGDPSQQNVGAPKDGIVWRRAPGLTQFVNTAFSGYRGGLDVGNLDYEIFVNEALTINPAGTVVSLGSVPGGSKISIARNQALVPDVVVVDPQNGAYVLASANIVNATVKVTLTGTVAGGGGDVLTFQFTNPFDTGGNYPAFAIYTTVGGDTLTSIATALAAAINSAAISNITATSAGPVVTITQPGAVGNYTNIVLVVTPTGGGTELGLFSPGNVASTGALSGGQGVPGVFTGTPTFYNGLGNLPQPNSVCFQDGYFFFTTGNNAVYASAINSLLLNALTNVILIAKADVILLRGIAYQGYVFFFTTGHCEIWQDQGNPAPNFPYSRTAVLTTGLLQSSAIAGYETGFDDLSWVAQDYGVWRIPQNSLVPVKTSPPDLDRLIEASFKSGDTIEAGAHIFAGKKYWTVSSSTWSWQFNLSTQKWNERMSLNTATGLQGRWRATGGHPAFSKWLCGDTSSGAILFFDDTNYYDVVTQALTAPFATTFSPQLMRIESGLVDKFPSRTRVARADFHFVRGVGVAQGTLLMNVTGAVAGTGGVVRLTVNSTLGVTNNDTGIVSGVLGTVEANGTWPLTLVDATHVELQGSVFVNAYTSGGTVLDVAVPQTLANPTVAIMWSDDGGYTWRGPVLRNLGPQSIVKTGRISVKNTGLTGVQGRRWRLDVSDPAYVAFLKGTQSDDPTNPS